LVFVLIRHFSLKTYIHTILFCCLFFSLKISAQSYHAGDITYSWVSGYTYSVKLTTYTSIGSTGLGDPCQDAFCGGPLMNRTNGPSSICGSSGQDGVPISSTIKMNEYVTTHTYPGPGNYVFCYEQPNRNSGIINIPNSVSQTMAFKSQLVIPTFTSGKNNSPVFANHPLAYGCLNNGCFSYNPMATDADGDSLSYELASCASSSGVITPGYAYPATGAGGTFSINPVTGWLTWCNPQINGDYNVVIRIKEWRNDGSGNYSLVGFVNRDTQFTIESCTGISDIAGKDQSISLYPNPVTDYLEIRFAEVPNKPYSIDITYVTGKTVASLLKDPAINPSMTFDMKELSSGIYFVKISRENKTIIKKIIKQ
jgi:hypothetical protein